MSKIKFVLLLFVFSFGFGYSQTVVGKLYSKTEANSIYGPVLTGIPISSSELKSYTYNTNNYIMFRINNGTLTILDDQRKALYPVASVINAQDVYRYISVSLVQKLISDGNYAYTYIELRNNGLITITNGEYTLEYTAQCPPTCPGN
jgi:hypothetical protein